MCPGSLFVLLLSCSLFFQPPRRPSLSLALFLSLPPCHTHRDTRTDSRQSAFLSVPHRRSPSLPALRLSTLLIPQHPPRNNDVRPCVLLFSPYFCTPLLSFSVRGPSSHRKNEREKRETSIVRCVVSRGRLDATRRDATRRLPRRVASLSRIFARYRNCPNVKDTARREGVCRPDREHVELDTVSSRLRKRGKFGTYVRCLAGYSRSSTRPPVSPGIHAP